ncbi:MAG: 4-phosphoerythronate dehydrogenase PdxB [Gammaproteobacteria bacterium]|nr:4-phosphoerythronate dehydrogenase PdxB [Gammaproteobacteria bacterium]
MKIIADENIPCVERAFASLGEVSLLPGRGMHAAQVRDADILLVRSVTRVDSSLLEGSSVRFVGSATIGFDHVDRNYLQQRQIGFATAPGSNATSAAEYVVSALLVLSEQQGIELAGKTAGIIGCGNVGSRVRQRLAALGISCLVNDPPLQASGGQDGFVSLDEVLQADIVTVHVPLTEGGSYPTRHLVDEALLSRLKAGAIFINTARGAVADNRALDRLLARRTDLSVVLDVWENEPAISASLLQKVDIGTPHIAGYSYDGKLRGTEMIYQAACDYFSVPVQWQAAAEVGPAARIDLRVQGTGELLEVARLAVLACYDVRQDDQRLRETLSLPEAQRATAFDRLRRDYPVRREFSECTVLLPEPAGALGSLLSGLGFTLLAAQKG